MIIDLLPSNTSIKIFDNNNQEIEVSESLQYMLDKINSITYTIKYPTLKYYIKTIKSDGFTVNQIVEEIIKSYINIYKNPKRYEVYYKNKKDLVLWYLEWDTETNEIIPYVGR